MKDHTNDYYQAERPTIMKRDYEANNYATDNQKLATVFSVGSMVALFFLVLYIAAKV